MSAPQLVVADFAQSLLALLPRGRVWPKDAQSVQAMAAAALAPTVQRHAAASGELLVDAFPASTNDLLPDWEKTLGLPDPCAGDNPTIESRVAQVVARLTSTGGQSVAYFIAFAAALGYVITITQFKPFRFGDPFGNPMYGDDWAHAWQVNGSTITVRPFEFGTSAFGEPFATWDNTVLECELRRVKPAHTVLIFNYS